MLQQTLSSESSRFPAAVGEEEVGTSSSSATLLQEEEMESWVIVDVPFVKVFLGGC
jgi:hypothetical protein